MEIRNAQFPDQLFAKKKVTPMFAWYKKYLSRSICPSKAKLGNVQKLYLFIKNRRLLIYRDAGFLAGNSEQCIILIVVCHRFVAPTGCVSTVF